MPLGESNQRPADVRMFLSFQADKILRKKLNSAVLEAKNNDDKFKEDKVSMLLGRIFD